MGTEVEFAESRQWREMFPGTVFTEYSDWRPVPEGYDPENLAEGLRPRAFGFEVVTILTASFEWPDGKQGGMERRMEGTFRRFFPGGVVLTYDEVVAEEGEHSILSSNMRANGWDQVAITRLGNTTVFDDNSEVL